MDPEELVVAYQASNPMEAQFIVDQLKGEGMKAVCDSLDMQNMLGPWDGNPRVYVHARDLDRARVWLVEYDEKQKERG
jgi:hypothetical protein